MNQKKQFKKKLHISVRYAATMAKCVLASHNRQLRILGPDLIVDIYVFLIFCGDIPLRINSCVGRYLPQGGVLQTTQHILSLLDAAHSMLSYLTAHQQKVSSKKT